MSYCGYSLKGSENGNVVAAQWSTSQLGVGRISHFLIHTTVNPQLSEPHWSIATNILFG